MGKGGSGARCPRFLMVLSGCPGQMAIKSCKLKTTNKGLSNCSTNKMSETHSDHNIAVVTEKSRDTALKTTLMIVPSPQNFNTRYLNLSDFAEFLGNESPPPLTLPFSTCQTSVLFPW